jgi:hypothetical protein
MEQAKKTIIRGEKTKRAIFHKSVLLQKPRLEESARKKQISEKE